jgi:hypothetical protein
MRGFFVQKFCAKLSCTFISGMNFFWRKNTGANAFILNVGEINPMFPRNAVELRMKRLRVMLVSSTRQCQFSIAYMREIKDKKEHN